MGCGGSKLDDLEAVALCRERSQHLEAAIRFRYSLARAHISYLHSLKSVASTLQRFFDDLDGPSPSSPFLPLPTHRKGDPDPLPDPIKHFSSPPSIPAVHHSHSHSNSGSHINFHSDSDSDSDAPGSGHSSPLHDHHVYAPQSEYSSPPRYYMNYARTRGPAPAVTYEQRLQSPQVVNVAESSYPYSVNPNSYNNYPSNPYSYSGYSNYGGINSFFGSPPPLYSTSSPPSRMPVANTDVSSSSREPPPPPSPQRTSSWDFLNPFESYAQYLPPSTPSHDWREVREEEGIPDLEDEENQHEVVKEVHDKQKFVVVDGGGGHSKAVLDEEDRSIKGEKAYGVRSAAAGETSGVEYEVHSVDKNVVANEKRSKDQGNIGAFKVQRLQGVSEIVGEIKEQFDKASDSGSDVSKILEVGKLPYRGRNAVYRVSSRMLDEITLLPVVSSQSSAFPSTEKVDYLSVDFEEDMRVKSKNLSSTLEKLYIWEKKLYEEVKAEEKMRIIHERKCKRLKRLDERGAEAHKIEATRTLVRNLSTKIRIALQFVDSISSKINKLRDEDLWPQIDELIQGLVRMWKAMLECHRSQCRIIAEAKNLDAVAAGGKLGESHMEATMQLEIELLNWILSFYAWISAQKSYIKALNGWLLTCLHCEPEETPDGIAPFSPGRIGAPPIFVICNHWSQVMDRISESEVFEAMQSFSVTVLQLWDKYTLEQRQRMMVNKDMDTRLKVLEREEQKMQKALDIVNKKLALVSEQNGLPLPGQIVHQNHSAGASSIQLGLKQIFEAMERFSDTSMKAYEELHLRSEEYRLDRENAKVP